ncbi:hypothetical protein P168DRAFT_78762 [Aspergillus campestris IBT 28561]|uniref:Uncharacterized protein n=1 Tax=Aspergillus campestris (strain IBT 28561) TaxID=1392248 RepID=A0A2I1CR01_ASPC2|nr:uncharacterized protein P168DRAFT_78762 [Aspergillus campestris IBT 28561]PKY00045.1 hypothetical protein P168DRAFT_78762 [Aspergillus campestris IBT 28561]
MTGRCRGKRCWLDCLSRGVNWATLYLLLCLPTSNFQGRKHKFPQAANHLALYPASTQRAVHPQFVNIATVVSVLSGASKSALALGKSAWLADLPMIYMYVCGHANATAVTTQARRAALMCQVNISSRADVGNKALPTAATWDLVDCI